MKDNLVTIFGGGGFLGRQVAQALVGDTALLALGAGELGLQRRQVAQRIVVLANIVPKHQYSGRH